MNWKGKRIRPASSGLPLFILSLFFVLGIVSGQALFMHVSEETSQELKQYISEFLRLEGYHRGMTAETIFSTVILYFRYPALALLFGFAAVGVVLLPGLTVAFGFFFSFAVSCFTAAFGKEGTLLAFAVLGLRCIISIPCYFLTAVPAWKSSAALINLYFPRGVRAASLHFSSTPWKAVRITALALLIGVFLDLYLSPYFLRYALEWLIT